MRDRFRISSSVSSPLAALLLVALAASAGAADARFQVSEELDASVSGAGSIAYREHPAVRQQISGFGSITQID